MTYNRISLRGYAGDDPQIRYIDPSTCIVSFRLATHSDGYISEEGRVVVDEVTEWHRVVCLYDVALHAEQAVRKGLLIAVEGRLSYRTTFSHEGQSRRSAFILADRLSVLTEEVRREEKEKESEAPNAPYGIYLDALDKDAEQGLPF